MYWSLYVIIMHSYILYSHLCTVQIKQAFKHLQLWLYACRVQQEPPTFIPAPHKGHVVMSHLCAIFTWPFSFKHKNHVVRLWKWLTMLDFLWNVNSGFPESSCVCDLPLDPQPPPLLGLCKSKADMKLMPMALHCRYSKQLYICADAKGVVHLGESWRAARKFQCLMSWEWESTLIRRIFMLTHSYLIVCLTIYQGLIYHVCTFIQLKTESCLLLLNDSSVHN